LRDDPFTEDAIVAHDKAIRQVAGGGEITTTPCRKSGWRQIFVFFAIIFVKKAKKVSQAMDGAGFGSLK
jgi:hypothetical protein